MAPTTTRGVLAEVGIECVGREVGIECDSDERPHVVLASSSTSTGQDSNGPGSTTARDRSTARTHDNNTNRHMLPLKTGEPERAANNARRKTQQPQRSAQPQGRWPGPHNRQASSLMWCLVGHAAAWTASFTSVKSHQPLLGMGQLYDCANGQ